MIIRPLIHNIGGKKIDGCRFAVGSPQGPRSNIWRISADTSGIYLKAFLQDKRTPAKISVHPANARYKTGVCHLALESPIHKKIVGDKPDRIIASWPEPPRSASDAAVSCVVYFSPEFFTKEPVTNGENVFWLPYPLALGHAVQLRVFRLPRVGGILAPGTCLGYWRFSNGDRYSVAVSSAPFETCRVIDRGILPLLRAMRRVGFDGGYRAIDPIGERQFLDIAEIPAHVLKLAGPPAAAVAVPAALTRSDHSAAGPDRASLRSTLLRDPKPD